MARNIGGSGGGCGTYAGVTGGYGAGTSSQTDSGIPAPPAPPAPHAPSVGDGSYHLRGAFVGPAAGFNLPWGLWLLGLEGDYSWGTIGGSSATCGALNPHGCGSTIQSFGTIRGRVGYRARGLLPYLTGGLAMGELKAWDALTPSSGSTFKFGWTVGGGVEFLLAQQLTMKIEYLYMDLGSHNLFDIVPSIPETVGFRANLFRVGVNYQFSDPSPPKSNPTIAK